MKELPRLAQAAKIRIEETELDAPASLLSTPIVPPKSFDILGLY